MKSYAKVLLIEENLKTDLLPQPLCAIQGTEEHADHSLDTELPFLGAGGRIADHSALAESRGLVPESHASLDNFVYGWPDSLILKFCHGM